MSRNDAPLIENNLDFFLLYRMPLFWLTVNIRYMNIRCVYYGKHRMSFVVMGLQMHLSLTGISRI